MTWKQRQHNAVADQDYPQGAPNFLKKKQQQKQIEFFSINSLSLHDNILCFLYLAPLIKFSSCITRAVDQLFYMSTELFLPCIAPTVLLFYTSWVTQGDSRLIAPRGTLSQNSEGWRRIFILQSKGPVTPAIYSIIVIIWTNLWLMGCILLIGHIYTRDWSICCNYNARNVSCNGHEIAIVE